MKTSMKFHLLIAVSSSIFLFFFMLNADYGFKPMINSLLTSLDYYLLWSVSMIDVLFIAGIPWIAFGLARTAENRSVKHQLGITVLFLCGTLVSFTFGFLLIDLTPNENPLLPSYVKAQPFPHYWSLCFGISHLVIAGMYLFDRKRKRDQQLID